jgi:hypothetical protein
VKVAVPIAVRPIKIVASTTFTTWKKSLPVRVQGVFHDVSPRIHSTRAINITHASDLVLQELICLFVYDWQLSIRYKMLHDATDLTHLQTKSKTLLKLLAIEITYELEHQLVVMPYFIRQLRKRLVLQVYRGRKPSYLTRKYVEQSIDNMTLNDHFASILGDKESLKQIQHHQKAITSTSDSDDDLFSKKLETARFNMIEQVKSRIFETRAMKSFRANLDTLVRAQFLEASRLKDSRKLGEIFMKNIIMSQGLLLAWKGLVNFQEFKD